MEDEPKVLLTRVERRRAMYPSRRPHASRPSRPLSAPRAAGGPETSRRARRTKVVQRRHRRQRLIWIASLTAVGVIATTGAALSLTGASAGDLPGAALRAAGWSAAGPQTIDGADSTIAARAVAASGPTATTEPSRTTSHPAEPSPTLAPASTPIGGSGSSASTPSGGSGTAAPAPDRSSSGGAASGDEPVTATPTTTTTTTAREDVTADDGPSSATATSSDLCVDYLQGTLSTSSLGYRKLVASANGSDLEMWCTDRVGDLTSVLALPTL